MEVGPLGTFPRWTYDGSHPGPEIRVKEGDRLRVRVENQHLYHMESGVAPAFSYR